MARLTERHRCPDCAEGIFEGNGKCGRCDGTGINTLINSSQPKCPYCRGTGVCVTCNGAGYAGGGYPGGMIKLDLG